MPRRGWWFLALGAICVIAAAHAAIVGAHYVVGSFDDDGHYLALAKAFAHGKGYVDTSAPGSPTETAYPPGYPLVLAPLVWLAPNALWPLRLLSAVAFVACIPLFDVLLRRRGLSRVVRGSALLLFALSPVAATFGTEVMPETLFLFVFLLVLVALPRWEEQQRLVTWSGAAVAFGSPYLLLLKTAGLPMFAGVWLWLALRRRWRHLAALTVTSILLIAPVIVIRLGAGSIGGDRYQGEYHLAGPLIPAAWHGAINYVTYAIPATLVPTTGANLMGHSVVLTALLYLLRYSAAALVAVGWWRWLRRGVDVSAVIVPFYLIETLPYFFINQRRVILLLPWAIAWYVLGWATVIQAARRWHPVARKRWAPSAVTALPATMIVALLAWQLPRDYLLELGESTPAARGSGYVAALRTVTPPGWSIAAGYRWTISDLTGRTASNLAHFTFPCPAYEEPGDVRALHSLLQQEHVATVLDAAAKWPNHMDQWCMQVTLAQASWAVPIYHGTDQSTVFTLLGPGTPRPDLSAAVTATWPASDTTQWGHVARVRELSVEVTDPVGDVSIELRQPDGRWRVVPVTSSAGSPVLLHVQLDRPVAADAVRVLGADASALEDLVVLAESK